MQRAPAKGSRVISKGQRIAGNTAARQQTAMHPIVDGLINTIQWLVILH
jgi:hypothetical protein